MRVGSVPCCVVGARPQLLCPSRILNSCSLARMLVCDGHHAMFCSSSDSDDSDSSSGDEASGNAEWATAAGSLSSEQVVSHLSRLEAEAATVPLAPLTGFEDVKDDFLGTQSMVHAFARHCREKGFAAEPFFLRKRRSTTLNLRNYSLGSDRAAALSLALHNLPLLMVCVVGLYTPSIRIMRQCARRILWLRCRFRVYGLVVSHSFSISASALPCGALPSYCSTLMSATTD